LPLLNNLHLRANFGLNRCLEHSEKNFYMSLVFLLTV